MRGRVRFEVNDVGGAQIEFVPATVLLRPEHPARRPGLQAGLPCRLRYR